LAEAAEEESVWKCTGSVLLLARLLAGFKPALPKMSSAQDGLGEGWGVAHFALSDSARQTLWFFVCL